MPLVVLVLFAGSADAELKDCFGVFDEARQSRRAALQACCTGILDQKKTNSQGWIWHEGLNVYVDQSKCDQAELRRNLIEKLRKKKPVSPGHGKPSSGTAKTGASQKRGIAVGTRAEYRGGKIIKEGGNFSGANLVGLVYAYGNADNANFEGADLRNANFEGTRLAGANFRNARLEGANFDYSYLKGATFTNAVLTGASLKGAVLRGANFIAARLTPAQVSVAFWAGAILDATLRQGLKDFKKGVDTVVNPKPRSSFPVRRAREKP